MPSSTGPGKVLAALNPTPTRITAFAAADNLVLRDEAQGRAALVETLVLQRCELVDPGQHDGSRTYDPGVGLEPLVLLDGLVHEQIAKVGQPAK